jgi:hypothetical protein
VHNKQLLISTSLSLTSQASEFALPPLFPFSILQTHALALTFVLGFEYPRCCTGWPVNGANILRFFFSIYLWKVVFLLWYTPFKNDSVTKLLGNRSRWRNNSVLSSGQGELARNRPYPSHLPRNSYLLRMSERTRPSLLRSRITFMRFLKKKKLFIFTALQWLEYKNDCIS